MTRPTTHLLRGFRLTLTIASLTLASTSASASEPAPRPPLAEVLTGRAKADYDAGKLLFADGDFAGALSKFKQAHESSHDPRLYWNMAVCEKNLRHYHRVQILTQKYLEEGAGVLSSEQTTQAQELLAAIKSFIALLKPTVNVDGAQVSIDGQVVAETPITTPLPVDLGVHRITVSKPGYGSFTKDLEVAGGTEATFDVVLEPESRMSHVSVHAATADTIAFDGKVVGAGRWESDVEPGAHTLQVTAPGRKRYEQKLDLASGANRLLQIALEPEAKSNTWLWIVGGVVAAAGIGVAGYFVLKPEDKRSEQPAGSLSPGLVYLGRGDR